MNNKIFRLFLAFMLGGFFFATTSLAWTEKRPFSSNDDDRIPSFSREDACNKAKRAAVNHVSKFPNSYVRVFDYGSCKCEDRVNSAGHTEYTCYVDAELVKK